MSLRSRRASLILPLLLAAGCSEPRHVESQPGATATPAPAPEPEPIQIKTREILGKTTTDVRDKEAEIAKGGARVATTTITPRDPITLPGNAYVTIVGRQGVLNVQHALDLYQAENGAYPKTVEEFRTRVLKGPTNPDGVTLPQLPYYQEYSYDPATHALIVLEYPDRKAGFQKQQDAKLGR